MLTFGKNTTSWEERSAMNEFIARHAQGITGVLSGFDRLVFRGTLRPISYPEGMMGYLSGNRLNPERRRVYREENTAERILSAGGGCGWGQSRGARVFLARRCWLRERVLAGLHWRILTFAFPFPAFFRACLG